MTRAGVWVGVGVITAPEHAAETSDYERYGQPLTLLIVRCGYIECVNRRRSTDLPDFDDSVIDASAIEHILKGDRNFKGGHRFTSYVVGKTVFPEDWSDAQIIAAVKAVVRRPTFVLHMKPFVYLRGILLGVIIEVALKRTRGRFEFFHAFPISGTGVYRNEALRRRELPLDFADLER